MQNTKVEFGLLIDRMHIVGRTEDYRSSHRAVKCLKKEKLEYVIIVYWDISDC